MRSWLCFRGYSQPLSRNVRPLITLLRRSERLAVGANAKSIAIKKGISYETLECYCSGNNFFPGCCVAGIFGAATLKWTTLLIQTAPGAIALFLVWILRWQTSSNKEYQTVGK